MLEKITSYIEKSVTKNHLTDKETILLYNDLIAYAKKQKKQLKKIDKMAKSVRVGKTLNKIS